MLFWPIARLGTCDMGKCLLDMGKDIRSKFLFFSTVSNVGAGFKQSRMRGTSALHGANNKVLS